MDAIEFIAIYFGLSIGCGLFVLIVIMIVEEIHFRLERRRYRLARK